MDDVVQLQHIGLQCKDKDEAIIFYEDFLGLNLKKTFQLSADLTKRIFDIDSTVEVFAFENSSMYVEVFIVPTHLENSCAHIALVVDDLNEFINRCVQYDISYYSVEKDEKTLWFVKDFSGNIFEIKPAL